MCLTIYLESGQLSQGVADSIFRLAKVQPLVVLANLPDQEGPIGQQPESTSGPVHRLGARQLQQENVLVQLLYPLLSQGNVKIPIWKKPGW